MKRTIIALSLLLSPVFNTAVAVGPEQTFFSSVLNRITGSLNRAEEIDIKDILKLLDAPSAENPEGGPLYQTIHRVGTILGSSLSAAFSSSIQEQATNVNAADLQRFFEAPNAQNQTGGVGYQLLKPIAAIVGEELGNALGGSLGTTLITKISNELYEQIVNGGKLYEVIYTSSSLLWQIAQKHVSKISTGIAIMGVVSFGAKKGIDLLSTYWQHRLQTPSIFKKLDVQDLQKNFTDLIYPQGCIEELKEYIALTQAAVKKIQNIPFQNALLYGKPGTGKTEFIKVLTSATGLPCFSASGGDLGKVKGKDLQLLDQFFDQVKSGSYPCIIFIDEIESALASREGNLTTDQENVITKLLTLITPLNHNYLVVAATNLPQKIDPAMRRRFGKHIHIGLPDEDGRKKIALLYIEKFGLNGMFNETLIQHIAHNTDGFSGADIELLINDTKAIASISSNKINSTEIIENALINRVKQKTIELHSFDPNHIESKL